MKKVRYIGRVLLCLLTIWVLTAPLSMTAYAAPAQEQQAVSALSEETTSLESAASDSVEDDSTGVKAIAAAVAIAIGAASGAIAMGIAIAKSSESIARQPEAAEKIRASLLLGLVFIETAVIYALVVAIMIVFVL